MSERDTCYFCRQGWGGCKCNWPVCGDDYVEVDGFDFQGVWITQPNVGVSGFPYVDPYQYYGEAFRTWYNAVLLCEDCMHVACGDDISITNDGKARAVERGIASLPDLTPAFDSETGTGTRPHSRIRCGCCGDDYAGPRYEFTISKG
jgi:hypothetical protein